MANLSILWNALKQIHGYEKFHTLLQLPIFSYLQRANLKSFCNDGMFLPSHKESSFILSSSVFIFNFIILLLFPLYHAMVHFFSFFQHYDGLFLLLTLLKDPFLHYTCMKKTLLTYQFLNPLHLTRTHNQGLSTIPSAEAPMQIYFHLYSTTQPLFHIRA